jgi:hypothetical protein
VPGSPDVQHLAARAIEQSVTAVHLFNNLGNLVGRLLFAVLVVRIASQRRLFRTFTLPALVLTPIVYVLAPHVPLSVLKLGDLVASALMVAQLSFWGNYLPRMYPTHLRGTGESFATNIGGRLIGTSAALIGALLVPTMPGTPPVQLAYATALVAAVIYIIALVVTPWLQEPADESLPE